MPPEPAPTAAPALPTAAPSRWWGARDRVRRHLLGAPRELALVVRGQQAEPALPVHAVVRALSPAQRVERLTAYVVGGSVAFVVHVLAMAVIHAVAFPLLLLVAVWLGVTRLFTREVWQFAAGRCPFCGHQQRFFVWGAVRLPARTSCHGCARELWLERRGEAAPLSGSRASGRAMRRPRR